MKVGMSVKKSIDDWELEDYDSAMMHACMAIDGTAKKTYPDIKWNNKRFTTLLRDNYAILGPMGLPGIALDTKFAVEIKNPTAEDGPDIADIIYGIHRCTHGHGEELPEDFKLIPVAKNSPNYTRIVFKKGTFQLSDRIIFALLAVAVSSPQNVDQSVPDGYHLSYGDQQFPINSWWGHRDDFIAALSQTNTVKLDFSTWIK